VAIKIKIPKANGGKSGRWNDPVVRAGLGVFIILALACTGAFSYFYIKYDRIIEKRFRTPVFSNSAKIYALPQTVRTGENINAKEIATELRRGGYSDKDGESRLGTFRLSIAGIESVPGRSPTIARSRRRLRSTTDKWSESKAKATSFRPTNWSRSW